MKINIEVLEGHSDSQKQIIRAFVTPKLREIWVACGTKYGKALSLDTEIITVSGFKKMRDIHEGDYVFDENGKPTLVEFATDPMYDHTCYRVEFSDGYSVIADAGHLWSTETHNERKNRKRTDGKSRAQVRTTEDIRKSLFIEMSGKPRPNHSIPLTKPVQFVEKNLPIDPYVLGVWLGDGSSNGNQLTQHPSFIDVFSQLETRGYPATKQKAENMWGISNLWPKLRESNLFGNKHVPKDYLFGSVDQRLDLLRGLMDTDGTICKRGHCSFDNTNKDLALAVKHLCASLGIKTNWQERVGKLNGVEKKLCYRVQFTTDTAVFYVRQKLERQRPVNEKSKTRYITDVVPVKSHPVKCIRVANPSHLFLCSEGFIPTHNTIAAVNAMILKAPVTQDGIFRWIAPIYNQSMIGFRYAKRFLPTTQHIKLNRSEPSIVFGPTNSRWEFRTGKDPESLEGEATTANILDECSKMTEEVYASTRTTTTVTGGQIMCISTPRGKNWFYKRCMAAKEEMEWALKNGKQPHRIFLTAPTSDNPHVSESAILDAQQSLNRRLFRQYYLAEFVDDGGTFANFRECVFTDRLDTGLEKERWFWKGVEKTKDNKFNCNVIIGADWAKKHDYTVFTAWDVKECRLIGFWRFSGVNYITAVKNLYNFGRRFRNVELVIHDETGIGNVIDDLLDKTRLPYQGVCFTSKNKSFMVNNMILGFEQRKIKIPYWPAMIQELDAYEVQTNEIGTMKFSAPNGMHDDIVSSMMLAWAAVNDYSTGELSVKIIEELKTQESITSDWESEYKDDEVQPWEQTMF